MGVGTERLRSAFFRFQNMSRSNFADLIVSAMTNRMAVAFDPHCRSERRQRRSGGVADLHRERPRRVADRPVPHDGHLRGRLRRGRLADRTGRRADPHRGGPAAGHHVAGPAAPVAVVAAFKLFHDPQAQMDYAILWLPG
jgi:hypothetical protein